MEGWCSLFLGQQRKWGAAPLTEFIQGASSFTESLGGEKRRYRQLQEKSLELQNLEAYSWQEETYIHIADKALAEGSWTQLWRSGDNRRTFLKS